jgi:protein-disulfide isomerase
VQFVEKDIRADPDALQELLQLGSRGTPTIVVNGEVIVGFNQSRLEQLLSAG